MNITIITLKVDILRLDVNVDEKEFLKNKKKDFIKQIPKYIRNEFLVLVIPVITGYGDSIEQFITIFSDKV